MKTLSPTGKNCHYQIDDCFFRFWFRFVFKYRGYMVLLPDQKEIARLLAVLP